MRNRRKLALVSLTAVLAVLLLCGFSSCDKLKAASVAVNRYGSALQDFQQGEIQAYNAGKIDGSLHGHIQSALKDSAFAGHQLDACISSIEQGADGSQCAADAQQSFAAFSDLIKGAGNPDLQVLIAALGAAFNNAISALHAYQLQHPAKAATGTHSAPLFAFFFLCFGMAFSAADAAGWITLISGLEQPAVDLILKLATSLKGQSTDQVLALNEQIFSGVEATAQAELDKLAAKEKSS